MTHNDDDDDDNAFRPILRGRFHVCGSFAEPGTRAHCRFRTRFHASKTSRSAEFGRVRHSMPPAREWELEPPRQAAQN